MALALGGCSALRLGYNNAPELAQVYLNSQFDFSETQGEVVKAELKVLHHWHRSSELPEWVKLLQRAQQLVRVDQTGAAICALQSSLRPRFDAVVARTATGMAQVALSATPEQLTAWQQSFDKRNAKWRDEHLNGNVEARQAKRLASARENFERVYGSLNAEQVALLRSGLARNPWDAAASLRESQRRQQNGMQTMRQIAQERPTLELAKSWAMAALERGAKSPDASYRNNTERWAKDSCDTWAALHNSTSPEQRSKAVSVLKGFEEDLRSLIR